MGRRATQQEMKIRSKMFKAGELYCTLCEEFLPISEFYESNAEVSNFGYRFHCNKHANEPANKAKRSNYHKQRNGALKDKYVQMAGGCCQKCGYSEHNSALDFHHVSRSSKQASPSVLIRTNDHSAILAELDKCCLLCRNCHTSYEAGQWKAKFVKRNGLGWTVK